MNRFSIRVHYGGELTELLNKEYHGGGVKIIDYYNSDRWSIDTLDRVAKKTRVS